MQKAAELVLSDVHLELAGACRPQTHLLSTFSFPSLWDGGNQRLHAEQQQDQQQQQQQQLHAAPPSHEGDDAPECDADGDLILTRRPRTQRTAAAAQPMHSIHISHHGATALPDVGLQVWRGECLLVDLLLHHLSSSSSSSSSSSLCRARTVLELGSGVGMATLALAKALTASPSHRPSPDPPPCHLFCTDSHLDSLHTAVRNLQYNFKYSQSQLADTFLLAPSPHPEPDCSGTQCSLPDACRPGFGARGAAMVPEGMNPPSTSDRAAQGQAQLIGPSVQVGMRRLDWLDFAACSSRGDAHATVRALLRDDDDAAGDQPAPGPVAPSSGVEGQHARGFRWLDTDMERLEDLDLIIAGDVVYDETLTEAMLKTTAALLQYASDARRSRAAAAASGGGLPEEPGAAARCYAALEKRWCFTLRDMDSRAPAFDHFVSLLHVHGGEEQAAASGSGGMQLPCAGESTGSGEKGSGGAAKLLCGRRLGVESIPQRLQGYERGPDLELWELWLPES